MKRTIAVLALALAVAGPTAAAEPPYRLAFVNATKVFEESPQYQTARSRLESEFARRDAELVAKQKQLKQLEDKLQRDSAILSDSELRRLERDILSRRRDLKNAQTEFREDLNLRQNEEFQKLRRLIREVIQEVGKAEQIDLVLSEGVVHFSERVDISERVLQRLQERFDASNGKQP